MIAYNPCTSTIADVSGKSAITLFNNPAVSPNPAGAPGGASCELGNYGAYGTARGFTVSLPAALGTGDFTVEFALFETAWRDPTDLGSQILITNTSFPPGGTVAFPSFTSGAPDTAVIFTGAGTTYVDSGATLNHWINYAASRSSGTTRLFRDGTLLASFADSSTYTDTVFDVSHQALGNYDAVMGSIGQIRVSTVGRYTSSYQTCADGFATGQ